MQDAGRRELPGDAEEVFPAWDEQVPLLRAPHAHSNQGQLSTLDAPDVICGGARSNWQDFQVKSLFISEFSD